MATVLTQKGEEWIIAKLNEERQDTGDYIGIGTGAGTADKSDTALFSEVETRAVATRSKPALDKLKWVGVVTITGAPKTITNAGNFTASSGGDLIIHGDFTGIPLQVGDGIEISIEMEQS